MDKPELFGENPNADIASQISQSNRLLTSLLSLQPHMEIGYGASREEKVYSIINDVVERIPENIKISHSQFAEPNSPIMTVLIQEVNRYNELLGLMVS